MPATAPEFEDVKPLAGTRYHLGRITTPSVKTPARRPWVLLLNGVEVFRGTAAYCKSIAAANPTSIHWMGGI